mgnify:FL=1|jgi:hypothetical protein|tara:strand:+ start:15063 stop:16949 length:1887 start_codon:yes stop_codon:yes gene_type:complete
MAYITSATTTTLELQLTDEGRKRILESKSLVSLFEKFAISDGDIDYRNTQQHADTNITTNDSAQLGYLPYVTGNLINFRKQINNGYKQDSIIWSTPESNTVNVKGGESTYVAVGVKTTNGSVKYYRDTLELDVYLHDYFVLNKLLASKYITDHKDVLSTNPTTIETSLDNYFNDTLNVLTSSDYNSFLNDLSEFGITQYLDFWDSVKVYDGANFNTEDIKMVPYKDFSYYNGLSLAGGAFMPRGENMGINFSGTYLKGLNVASPFSLVFSPSLNSTGSRYTTGSGSAGIGFEAFGMGYLNCGGVNTWNDDSTAPYPTFDMTNKQTGWSVDSDNITSTFIGFVTAVDMETSVDTEVFAAAGYSNITTTIPTARLVLNITKGNDTSPTYYPIKLKRLSQEQGAYQNINSQNAKGINITHTTHPSDTFGLLIGGLEYSSNWNTNQQGFRSSGQYFGINPSKDNSQVVTPGRVAAQTEPYYTLSTRMMKMADDIFVGVASQNNNFWMTDTYSGGFRSGLSGSSINHYNISIPVTWTVYSKNSPGAAPCKVTVRFKFNKEAVTDSISYNNVSSQNYYRIYDDAEFKFYGAAGETKTSFSPDPRGFGYASGASTTWTTSGGDALFRKVITGQEI